MNFLKKIIYINFITVLSISISCNIIEFPAVVTENRHVKSVHNPFDYLEIKKDIFWGESSRKGSLAVNIPSGKYILEAEGRDYYYFKSPENLEFFIIGSENKSKSRTVRGGLCLSKKINFMVPAAVYVSKNKSRKTIKLRLGESFMKKYGELWERKYIHSRK